MELIMKNIINFQNNCEELIYIVTQNTDDLTYKFINVYYSEDFSQLEKYLRKVTNKLTKLSLSDDDLKLSIQYYFAKFALNNNLYPDVFPELPNMLTSSVINLGNKIIDVFAIDKYYYSESKNKLISIMEMATKHIHNSVNKKLKNNEIDEELTELINELVDRVKEDG
jgi:hypothetical protein